MSPAGAVLLSAQHEGTVSVGVVRGLLEAVERAGVSREQFVEQAGPLLARLGLAEARMPLREMQQICELALSLTADPALGLHWAGWLSERMFVPVSHLIAHSKSLRHGFELLAQFLPLLCDQAAYRVLETAQEVIVQRLPMADESLPFQHFSAEMMMGGFWRLIGSFNGRSVPGRVCFQYSAPAQRDEYETFFEGAVSFDQPFTGVVFDRALLDAPSPQKDDGVREALEEVAERRMLRINRSAPYSVRVRQLLVQSWQQGTEMQRVARALELSVRSLRRQLLAESKSYNELVNEALAIVATNLLRDERRTIQEVAYELGFSEMSAFYRAFKRWTGTTPGAWREAQHG